MIKIIKATSEHLNQLAELFDLYRVFYKQESDVQAAKVFLTERFAKNESVVFMAFVENHNFTTLSPQYQCNPYSF